MATNQKIIGEAAEIFGLKFVKKKSLAYGVHRNYTMIMHGISSSNRPYIRISLCVSFQGNPIHPGYLQGYLQQTSLPDQVTCSTDRFRINILLQVNGNKDVNVNKIVESVRKIIDFVNTNGGINSDEMGVVGPTSVYSMKGNYTFLSDQSAGSVYTSIKKDSMNEAAKRENYLLGGLGAVIGSLAGVLLILLIARLGRVSSFSGVVMGIAVVFGYKKLANKFSKVSIVICTVVSILMTYLAFCLDAAIDLYQAFQGDETFGYCFMHIKEIFSYTDSLDVYYHNLSLIMIVGIIGTIAAVWIEFSNQKKQFEIYKLE